MQYQVSLLMGQAWVVALLSGLGIGAAFLHPWLWWVGVLGGALLLTLATQATSCAQAMRLGWLVGIVKSLIVLSWFWSSYPMDWMGLIDPLLQVILISIYWIPAAITIGSGYALLTWSMYVLRKSPLWKQVAGVASAWVLADVLGAIIFSIYTLGPGSYVNSAFSFGFYGYPLATHQWLVQFAQLGGAYALTFVAAGVTVVGVWLYTQQRFTKMLVIAGVVWVTSLISPFWIHDTPPQGMTVAVVHTSFDKDVSMRGDGWTFRQSTLYEVTLALASSPFTHVVFPEDVRYRELLPLTSFVPSYTDRFGKPVVVVDTGRVDTATATSLRAFVTDGEGNRSTYDKQYLVPQGEYVPYVYQLLMRAFGMNQELEQVISGTNYVPGKPYVPEVVSEDVPKVLFCFESVNPKGVRSLLRDNETPPPFIAHAVSHAWFNNEPEVLWYQLDLMLKTQAVWNQVPIIQAANETHNKIYWPSGFHEVLEADVGDDDWHISFVEL